MNRLSYLDIEHLRCSAKRLERYAARSRENLWTGDRDQLIHALADCAETGEIARRLYLQIQDYLRPRHTPRRTRAKRDRL